MIFLLPQFIKVNVKLSSLCFIKCHTIKMYVGVEIQLHTFFLMALDGGEWSAPSLGNFILKYVFDMRLGGPKTKPGHDGKKKNPNPTPNHPACS
jgi:hypothetical protein